MTKKSSIIYKLAVSLLLLAVVFSVTAFPVYYMASGLLSLPLFAAPGGTDQTVGGDEPSYSEIVLPTVNSNPYKPTVHQYYYPVVRSKILDFYDSAMKSIETNGRSADHSDYYTASLGAMLGYYVQNRYAGSYAKFDGRGIPGIRSQTLHPDLAVYGQKLTFGVNTGGDNADNYTNFLTGSYVYDVLHLNKDHLTLVYGARQQGYTHVVLDALVLKSDGKTYQYDKELTTNGQFDTLRIPLGEVVSISGSIDGYRYNGSYTDVMAMLVDDTSPSVTDISISQQIHENDDADLIMKLSFNEGIRFADYEYAHSSAYLNEMWIEVEIEDMESGEKNKIKLYASDVGNDCTMTLKANIGRYHYKKYRVNRITGVGFPERHELRVYTGTAIDVKADLEDGPEKALYSFRSAYGSLTRRSEKITAVTDMAGNSLNLDSIVNWSFGEQFNEPSFGIEQIEIHNDKTLAIANGKIGADSLLPENLFISSATDMTIKAYISRTLTENQWKQIRLKLNVKDPSGNYITVAPTRAMEYSRNYVYDNGTIKGSVVLFEKIRIPVGAKVDVEAGADPVIIVTEVIESIPDLGFYPYFDRPITDMRLDSTAPTVAARLLEDKKSEEEGNRYYSAVVELVLADTVDYERIAGLVGGEVTVSLGAKVEDEVDFRYLLSTDPIPPTSKEGYTAEATIAKGGYERVGSLTVANDPEKLYLHIFIDQPSVYLEDLLLDVRLTDAAGNLNDAKDLPILLDYVIDEVPPEVKIVSKTATATSENTKIVLDVSVAAVDHSVVEGLQYYVGDDPGAEGVSWTPIIIDASGTDVTGSFIREYGGIDPAASKVISETIWVRAYDKFLNYSEPVSTYVSLSLEKPATRAELKTDGMAVSTYHELIVDGPAASTLTGDDAYTRVTITPIGAQDFIYVVLVRTGEKVSILDLLGKDGTYSDKAQYYKVKTERSGGDVVYTEVEGPVSYSEGDPLEGHLLEELFGYYGELKISFENGYGSMLPAVGDKSYESALDGSYYKDPNYLTVRFASPLDEDREVHSVSFGKLVDRKDEIIAEALPEGADPILIRQSEIGFGAMRNMQIHFSIANIADASFGYLDLDYENSFIEFYKVGEGGDVLVDKAVGISASGSQYFTVGNTDMNGSPYETGAYYLSVTVRSLSGHEDTYTSGRIVLDAQVADSAGVWEYSYSSPGNINKINDPTSYSAIVKSRDPLAEDYFTDFGISVITGGETMRSRLFAVYSYGVDSITVELSAPGVTKTVEGLTVGAIEGFKLWNILSAPTQQEIDSAHFELDLRSDSLTVYNRLNEIYDKNTIPKGADAIGSLHLVKGVNTFCYQAKLENGYVTPVRYFTVTVTDKAPTLNVAIEDYIPSHNPSDVESVVNIDSIRMFIETAYSFNGSGELDVQLWSTYGMKLGIFNEDGVLEQTLLDTDVNGEELINGLTILRSGLKEGEYAILTENSYTSDFPHYNALCTAAFVAIDEYGGVAVVAPQLGNAQRHNVYGGVAYEKEYNISYVGQYFDNPYFIDDGDISWRVMYNEASYNGNILLGFESYLVKNVDGDDVRVEDRSVGSASLGRNLFHISTNDIYPNFSDTVISYGADLQGATVRLENIDNADLITTLSTITIWGDGIDGEVTLPLFEANTEYGFTGAELAVFGYDSTEGIEFGFGNPRATAESPAGTERKLYYRLEFDNGYGETYSSPEYYVYEDGAGEEIKRPLYGGELTLYYIDYGVKNVSMTESGAVVTPTFATIDGIGVGVRTGKFSKNNAEGSGGYHTVEFTDLYGNRIPIDYLIDDIKVDDIDSTVEISTTAKTANEVTVTIKQSGNKVYADIIDYDIMSVDGNGTDSVTVTLTANARFSYRYLDHEGNEKMYFILVDNIVKPKVEISFSPDISSPATDPLTGEKFIYGEVNAYVSDPNFEIIDKATGAPPIFTFTPGGSRTYTFAAGTLVARLGNGDKDVELGEITVSLPYPQREIPEVSFGDEDDAVAPAIQVLAYSSLGGEWSEEKLLLQLTSRRDLFSLSSYDGYTVFAFSGERANMAKLLERMGWSTSYRFLFEISDANRVRLFVKEGLYAEAPSFENGVSDEIEGVELNSKLLTVTGAAKFTVFAVDREGNVSSVAFDINNVGEAPRPTVRKVVTDKGVRAYLVAPEGATELEILSAGMQIGIETEDGEYKGLPYVDLTENDTYQLLYKMKYNGTEIKPATVDVSVSELRPNEISLVGAVDWSANKLREATAEDVVARLLFTEEIASINTVGDFDAAKVEFLRSGSELTVTFKDNHAPLSFRCYAEDGSFVTVELDAVTNIDRTAPVITYEKLLAPDAKSMTVTLKVNERVTFKEGGGFVGELIDSSYVYVRTVTANGIYTYTFTDMSGISSSVSVSVSELVLEPLSAEFAKEQDGSGAVTDPALLELKVGETVFVKPSRNASVRLSDGREITAPAGEWTPIAIPEALGGVSPYVTVTDEYGNVYLGQFASVTPLDKTPPELVINKDVWTVRAGGNREELLAALRANATAFDDSGESILIDVTIPEDVESVGIYDVRYSATDSSGNTTELYGRLRVTSIYDPIVYIGDLKVDRDDGIYLGVGEEITLTVNSAGVEFDLYWCFSIIHINASYYILIQE